MNFILPDVEVVIEMHDVILDLTGGRRGIHDPKLIHSAITRPQTYTQYVEDFDLDTICALLIDGIARYHGFNDGNKRTALMTAFLTYRINEVHFTASIEMNEAFDGLVMWVVTHKPSIEDISARLKELRQSYEGNKNSWFTQLQSMYVVKVMKDLKKKLDDK